VLPDTMQDPDSPLPNGPCHCPTCVEHTDEATRASMHCGWMPREQWAPGMDGVPPLGPDKYEVDVCPGWLVRQPMVMEGAKAGQAREEGILQLFDPEGLALVWDMAEIFKRAMNLYQARRMKQLKARA
jgi:hypothetical protein